MCHRGPINYVALYTISNLTRLYVYHDVQAAARRAGMHFESLR